jgi:hypothetical protein
MCAYCDANWVGGIDDHKSTLGFFNYWEMVLLVGITKKKLILLCHQ